jgi:hypothetical protein
MRVGSAEATHGYRQRVVGGTTVIQAAASFTGGSSNTPK